MSEDIGAHLKDFSLVKAQNKLSKKMGNDYNWLEDTDFLKKTIIVILKKTLNSSYKN